ncbi:MAG: ATP F0F1 synthase subunit B [Parvibaculaceae bacterium]
MRTVSNVLPSGLTAALLLPVLPGAAWASEGGGMPQLKPEVFSPQLIWLAITFVILYLLMSKALLPKIGGAIESRRNRIAADLDQAEALKAETERAVEAYEAGLAEARAKANAIAAETHAAVSAEAAGERERVDREMAGRIAEAERRISATRDQALGEIGRVAADVAGEIVASLTGRKASEAEIAAAVAQAQGK